MMFFVSLFSLAILGSACASPHKTDDSAGCGLFHKDKNHTVTITSGNVPREFLVHLPDTYDENAATSVILSYHGRGKTMREQQRISGLSNATLNPDMIAVYPQGCNVSDLLHWLVDPV
jgi:polyhydroxybutyrate depolymerase